MAVEAVLEAMKDSLMKGERIELRGRAHVVSRVARWLCVALIYFGPSWILWSILVRLVGRPHPPTLDDAQPIGTARVLIGIVSLIVFVLCFVPDPVLFSWRDAWSELRQILPQH